MSQIAIDGMIIVLLICGISLFRSPRGARAGNLIAALALLLSGVLIVTRNTIHDPSFVVIALLAGSAVGLVIAMKVSMIQIPAMVAFQHGAGGIAAFLISYAEITRDAGHLTEIAKVSGILGLVIGAATFSGSMIASGKLSNKLKQTPKVFRAHNLYLLLIVLVIALLSVALWNGTEGELQVYGVVIVAVAILLGVVFSIRIGGADMPVLISFLNATAGLAAAFCGIIIQNKLLVACGATVTASGSILTAMMCKAMNRSLLNIFVGTGAHKAPAGAGAARQEVNISADPQAEAVECLNSAKSVIMIPGYGMAMAQAQFKVVELANKLESAGKTVKFAIHPVAGRMPGHMNVLLAEADLPYEKLFEMDDINPEFKDTDVAMIIGACDVVNPEAITAEGTPIYGMPILHAHEAKNVVVCNLDTKPGYSGVENTLYSKNNVIMVLGNAADTLTGILEKMQ